MNLYGFVDNNALNSIDYLGLQQPIFFPGGWWDEYTRDVNDEIADDIDPGDMTCIDKCMAEFLDDAVTGGLVGAGLGALNGTKAKPRNPAGERDPSKGRTGYLRDWGNRLDRKLDLNPPSPNAPNTKLRGPFGKMGRFAGRAAPGIGTIIGALWGSPDLVCCLKKCGEL